MLPEIDVTRETNVTASRNVNVMIHFVIAHFIWNTIQVIVTVSIWYPIYLRYDSTCSLHFEEKLSAVDSLLYNGFPLAS